VKPVNTVFAGTSFEGESILRSLNENKNFNLVGVITQPDKPVGRHQKLQPTRIKQVATELKLKVFEPNKKDENYQKVIDEVKPDLVIVLAFGEFLPDVILNYPKYKCLNVHYSLLPQLRGACPVQMAIMQGLEKTGVTIQIMEHDMDVGPILAQKDVEITDSDTTETLKDKLIPAGKELIISMLPKWIAREITPQSQDDSKATYCYIKDVSKEAAQIDWEKENPKEIERKVRALQPRPVAWTMLNGKRLKIYESEIIKNSEKIQPGNLLSIEDKPAIATKNPEIKILLRSVQLEGKKRMTGEEFLRGIRI
jgi:methionyl-tRNA formyltransferase